MPFVVNNRPKHRLNSDILWADINWIARTNSIYNICTSEQGQWRSGNQHLYQNRLVYHIGVGKQRHNKYKEQSLYVLN